MSWIQIAQKILISKNKKNRFTSFEIKELSQLNRIINKIINSYYNKYEK